VTVLRPSAIASATAQVVHLCDPAVVTMPRPRQRAILVLGMSRSGTSLMTRLCNLAGATLPTDLIGSGFGNPLGHWEPTSLVALNEEILAALDRRWDDARPVPGAWFRSRQAHPYLARLCDAVARCCGSAALSVIKDPRISRLLPLYLSALDALDVEPLIVLQVRSPLEVIQSLVYRDGLDPNVAELLWVRSIAEAEFYTRDCRRIWVDARSAIDEWQETLDRIAQTFQLAWPNSTAQIASAVEQFLKPRLLHRTADLDASPLRLGLIASLAWGAVTPALAGETAGTQQKFETLHGLMADIDRLHAGYINDLAADRRRLRAVLASRSWRVTAPVRWVTRMLRGC
jgi:hypothetical protein